MSKKYRLLLFLVIILPFSFMLEAKHGYKTACINKNLQRNIAITIDDLPNNISGEEGMVERIAQILLAHHAPAIGFVIANQVTAEQWAILEKFKKQGFLIGNHTYSHMKLKRTSAEQFIGDIDRADKILQPLMTDEKYFRYPYMNQGKWGKKQQVSQYLAENRYINVPITIDSRDFEFNVQLYQGQALDEQALNQLKQQYLDFVWKQTVASEANQNCKTAHQILLLHANRLNQYFLNDLLHMYESQGYRFITIAEAVGKATI